ncbi:hypothetical protein [Candidatus Soleaferrea massiliensis]|uniref:hypothetical protein n=1 Tax=Candidatus Soleaferrea massiliensis TaxID=1470354 RepID=UPI0012E00CAC|nr:hypothetical protein [Candidatus Soleaferrea massiliensis]
MEIKVKRIISWSCLLCELLLLPACTTKETASSGSEELSRVQSLDSIPAEAPTITPTEPASELFSAVYTVASLSGEPSNPSQITESSSEVSENKMSSSPERAVSSPSSEATAAPQTASYPPEEAYQSETSPPELFDTPPPVLSDAPRVEAMGSAYLYDLLSGVNSHRSKSLNMDADLSVSAQAHAEEMAQSKSLYHSCSGVESVGKGAFEDGVKEGSMLTVHCSDLASEELIRIGAGAARDEDGSIYVCILGKTY